MVNDAGPAGKNAKYVLVIMGSGAGVVEEYLTKMGDKAGTRDLSLSLSCLSYPYFRRILLLMRQGQGLWLPQCPSLQVGRIRKVYGRFGTSKWKVRNERYF